MLPPILLRINAVNQYLVARYGDPCRRCGFVWTLDRQTARELVEGASDRLSAVRRAPAELRTSSDGAWGAAGYIAHLADTFRIWAVRLAAASLDPGAVIAPYDEGLLGDVIGYDRASLEASLWALDRAVEDWRAARSLAKTNVRLKHPEQGSLTADGAQTILAHEVHHHTMDIWAALIPGATRVPIRTSDLSISRDDPHAPDVAALLRSHLLFNRTVTPRGHVHALEVDDLSGSGIDLFAARVGGDLAAIGAFRRLSDDRGELKSMHTEPLWRGRGVGAAMVLHLLDHAVSVGCTRVSLETGSMPVFEPARRLYSRLGFVRCPAFGEYTDNPHSVCMTKMGGNSG